MAAEHEGSLRRLEDRLAHLETADYVLTLFVNGASDMSVRAIGNVRALCELHLADRYQLEVVDVHRDAELMSQHQVLAVPTLIREQPLPQRRIVGDLSDASRVLAALDIRTTPERGYG
jgi:circadian clock protein KaiB